MTDQTVIAIADSSADLDPHWNWFEITALGDPCARWLRGPCRHLDVHLVTSTMTGEPLAQLCATCDAQLPPPPKETP